MEIRNILTVAFLMVGLFFFVVSAIGIFRMKDIYCRLHVAGIISAFGFLLSSVGLFIYEGLTITGLKILVVFIASFLVSPIGTHIIAKVAYKKGQELAGQREEE